MYELKISSPEFILKALSAGKNANYEGAILIFARGLSDSHKSEILDLWSSIDDVTHNDILVLTFGIQPKHNSGITAYSLQRNVIADDVSVAYSYSGFFNKAFEGLLSVANHVPSLNSYSNEYVIDSHGTTDIRRMLGIAERQLPGLFLVSYRQKADYFIELGDEPQQLSPVQFINTLAKNLDDIPYKSRVLSNERKQINSQYSELSWRLRHKKDEFVKIASLGQLESISYHLNQILVDAPSSIKKSGDIIIEFLSGKNNEDEIVRENKQAIIKYVLSLQTPEGRRLPKKLRKALGRRYRNEPFTKAPNSPYAQPEYIHKRQLLEAEINELTNQILSIKTAIDENRKKQKALNVEGAFSSALETTLTKLGFETRYSEIEPNHQLLPHVRYVCTLIKPSTSNNHISILFLSSDPTNTNRLRLGEELREIHEKLQLAKLRDRFDLQTRMSVRPADVSQALLDIQPKIVHFSGHGSDKGELFFESQTGQAHPVEPDALAGLFKQFSHHVKCVILNACYAEAQAKAIAEYVDYVIGMKMAISDKAAIAFAVGFYQGIGAGRTIKDAFNLGCVQIGLQNIPEHLTPILICRK